jgi:hypothetical protein
MDDRIPSTPPHKRHDPSLRRMAFVSAMVVASAAFGCTSNTGVTHTTSATVQPAHTAHALLVDAASCWFGGMWGDVQGESPAEREQSSNLRCDAVVTRVYGHGDKTRFLRLRAYDPETLAHVRTVLVRDAKQDPTESARADVLAGIFTALAAAQEETTFARRAAHRVLRDLDHEPERLSEDEVAALPQLQAVSGFQALYRMDAGDLRAEAHALALIVLLDRMNVAQMLPVHLKPYVVALPFKEVFSAPMPTLPYDAGRPLGHGAWLAYLESTATQARHPIRDYTRPPIVRHEEAVAGILEGVADQLRADADAIHEGTPLARVVHLTIRALEQSRARVML